MSNWQWGGSIIPLLIAQTSPLLIAPRQINCNLAAVGQPMVFDPPAPARFGPNAVRQFLITNVNGAIALKLNVVGNAAQCILVLGTKPRSAGVSYVDHFTIIGLLPAQSQGVIDITDLYVGKYGAPQPGSRIFIQTMQQINGWQDLPQQLSAIVPAP
jgi:hypothetical protein